MKTLIIDGDVLVYRFAFAEQVVVEWERDLWTQHAWLNPAKVKLDEFVQEMLEQTKCDEAVIALSDLDNNWRQTVDSEYKLHRSGTMRPILFKPLRQFLLDEYHAAVIQTCEGDDVIGILGTDRELFPEGTVMASIDKDLKTVPGRHYNWDADNPFVFQVSKDEAKYNHLYQTLTGDRTDGYSGCPGIGPVKAKRMLDNACTWDVVRSAYAKAGLSEEEALRQARLAYVLQHQDYDAQTGRVLLWRP